MYWLGKRFALGSNIRWGGSDFGLGEEKSLRDIACFLCSASATSIAGRLSSLSSQQIDIC